MPRFSTLVVVATAIVAAIAPIQSAAAAQGPAWSVSPAPAADGSARPNFDFSVDPGAVVDDAFVVKNNGATPLTLQLYAADAFTTREGNIDLLAPGKKSIDSGTWVALSAPSLTLQPGQTEAVPFRLSVPANATPGDHPTGIVASLTSNEPGATVQLARRLGTRMQIRVSGELRPSVAVSGLKASFSFPDGWNPFATGTVAVSYALRNTGNARVTAGSVAGVHGPLGIGAATSSLLQTPEILPGSTIVVTQRISGVGALFWLGGTVTLSPESVGLGARTLERHAVRFTLSAVPITLVIALGLLAGLVVALVLVLRRRSLRRRA